MHLIPQNVILLDVGYLSIGFFCSLYLYRRNAFPRPNRYFWGYLFILYGSLGALGMEMTLSHALTLKNVLPHQANAEMGTANLVFMYSLLKLIFPFSFAAVGAGLVANSLVART